MNSLGFNLRVKYLIALSFNLGLIAIVKGMLLSKCLPIIRNIINIHLNVFAAITDFMRVIAAREIHHRPFACN